jgi:hypothetical protein
MGSRLESSVAPGAGRRAVPLKRVKQPSVRLLDRRIQESRYYRAELWGRKDRIVRCARENCQPSDLPETRRPRFGEELNAEKMKKAIWLRPEAVAQIEFLE